MAARILMRINHEGIERIREHAQAHLLSDRDREGPLKRELQDVHVGQVKGAYKSQGATVATGPWPAWSTGYAKWRSKYAFGIGHLKMMRLTDTLYEKSTMVSHPNFIGRFVRPFKYRFGFRDDVGYQHQHGIGHLPRRSLIDKTQTDIRQFIDTLLKFWQKRIEQVNRHA